MCFEFIFRGNRYFIIIYIYTFYVDECHILFLDDVFVNNYNVAMAHKKYGSRTSEIRVFATFFLLQNIGVSVLS